MSPLVRSLPRLVPMLLLSGVAACGGGAPGGAPRPEAAAPVGWRVDVAEYVGLWYHGLAYALGARETPDSVVVPRFEPAYVDSIVQVKRRLGVYPTVLDRRAEEFGRLFSDREAYAGLQFVPLYFQSTAALFSGITLWAEVGGDPRRAGSVEAARVVAFLSTLFPRAEQRRAVADWADALREERQEFYTAYWQEHLPGMRERVAAVQREWNALVPALSDYLDYLQLKNGELFLVPALGAEGRMVTQGLPAARAAVMEPDAAHPGDAVLVFVHETVYPVARDAVRDFVSPARIRELGEQRLLALAAVRGGEMLLEETAPAHVGAYRQLYLRAAGRSPTEYGAALEAAFREAFPLPEDLENGLRAAIHQALAGI